MPPLAPLRLYPHPPFSAPTLPSRTSPTSPRIKEFQLVLAFRRPFHKEIILQECPLLDQVATCRLLNLLEAPLPLHQHFCQLSHLNACARAIASFHDKMVLLNLEVCGASFSPERSKPQNPPKYCRLASHCSCASCYRLVGFFLDNSIGFEIDSFGILTVISGPVFANGFRRRSEAGRRFA